MKEKQCMMWYNSVLTLFLIALSRSLTEFPLYVRNFLRSDRQEGDTVKHSTTQALQLTVPHREPEEPCTGELRIPSVENQDYIFPNYMSGLDL